VVVSREEPRHEFEAVRSRLTFEVPTVPANSLERDGPSLRAVRRWASKIPDVYQPDELQGWRSLSWSAPAERSGDGAFGRTREAANLKSVSRVRKRCRASLATAVKMERRPFEARWSETSGRTCVRTRRLMVRPGLDSHPEGSAWLGQSVVRHRRGARNPTRLRRLARRARPTFRRIGYPVASRFKTHLPRSRHSTSPPRAF
jgi:hypothetical protein